jgi:uncharacterized membrane protein YebE (DUF533 family)
MKNKAIPLVLTLSLILNACASATKSTLLGGAIGGLVGAGLGQAQSHNSGGTAIGAAVGAGLGSLIGYAAFSDSQKKDAKAVPLPPLDNDLPPSLTKPRVRSYMVPDTIEGNKYIKGHKVFILEDPGSWTR